MHLDEGRKEQLRTMTVEMLLELRSAYLRTPGVNALKHWTQIQDRLRAAARTTSSVEEWETRMRSSLQLGAPNSRSSEVLQNLASTVREWGAENEWLQLLEDEYGFLMALTRLLSEQRKEVQNA